MTITTENQAVILVHKWQGIASSVIGVTSIIFNSLLVGIAMSGTKPPTLVNTALLVLSSGMLFANLIGIALGFGRQGSLVEKTLPAARSYPQHRHGDDLVGVGHRWTVDERSLTSAAVR